jgi:hypothetical protein
VFIAKAGAALNPAVWVSGLRSAAWTRWMSRSGRVIEVASQQAVEHILSETLFFQVWVGQSPKAGDPSVRTLAAAPSSSQKSFSAFTPKIPQAFSSVPSSAFQVANVYLGHDYEERWLREEGSGYGGRRESGLMDMKWSERFGRGEHFSEGVGVRERAGPRAESGSRVRRERLVYASGDEDAGEGFVMDGKMRRSVSGNRG